MSENHGTKTGAECYRPRCKAEAEFAVDQMSWRSLSCARHLGDLVVRRTTEPTFPTATVTHLAGEAANR